jgi:protocatechuate 3,4-dioxygenase, beta subunit
MLNVTQPQAELRTAALVPLLRTPNLILGPFYPLAPPAPAGAELWCAHQARQDRRVQPVEVSGRVINLGGIPVASALVEAWQSDERGRYHHPSAPKPAPDDAGFVGYGALRTDASGRYCFRTLKPGAYVEGARRRAPHIHFQVTGAHDRLVTQMFFPHEPLNAEDHWYRAANRSQQLVATVVRDTPERLQLSWDIVLSTG